MKHSIKITSLMLIIFLLSQLIGIGVIYSYIDFDKSVEEGKTVFENGPTGERPLMEGTNTLIMIFLAIIIGTIILFILMKYQLILIWKFWFLIAIIIALWWTFNALLKFNFLSENTKNILALLLAIIFAVWKIFRPNVWIHNITELFIYGGLAAIFVPMFNLVSVIILLILISLYDAYAVWKSKHMITLAKSQAKAKLFSGLMIPHQLPQKIKKVSNKIKKVPVKIRTAVLGGGDMAFPIIFSGVILKELGLWQSLIIPIFATLGLAVIFFKGNKNKYYPAMPFITMGCFLGLGIVFLIGLTL